jgi:hypothetical protein
MIQALKTLLEQLWSFEIRLLLETSLKADFREKQLTSGKNS